MNDEGIGSGVLTAGTTRGHERWRRNMAFARGALHLTSVAHIHCRLERSRPWTISPQPHPNFIEVSGDAAPGDRYWAVEGAGEDGQESPRLALAPLRRRGGTHVGAGRQGRYLDNVDMLGRP